MTPPPEKKEPKKPRKKLPRPHKPRKISLPWLIILALIIFSVFMYTQYREAKHKLQTTNPNTASSSQVNTVIAKVRKLVVLPANQTPTVLTVKDASKLKNEQFYANAQNGDITLVYTKEKEAILYRPSTNQIVTIASVTVAPSTSTP
jgi:hypothetical protein